MKILTGGAIPSGAPMSTEYPLDFDIPVAGTIQGVRGRHIPQVEHQGELQSCVGHAVTSACEYLEGDRPEFSRMFVWYWARWTINKETENSPCFISDGVRAVCQFGVPPESYWLHRAEAMGVEPPDSIMRIARKSVSRYQAKPANGLNEIRMWLADGIPVVGGFHVPHSISGSAFVPDPEGQTFSGGHAVLFTGYDDDLQTLTFENSWGTDWGVDGFGYLPYSYFFTGHAFDCWAIYR